MDLLTGIKNFLFYVNENWTTILVCIGLCIGIINKIQSLLNKSKEERIEIIKEQIKETILKRISDAELDYEEWNKAGSIKRSQVIKEIFDNYPILSKVVNQNDLIKYIDKEIDNALITLREVIEQNK